MTTWYSEEPELMSKNDLTDIKFRVSAKDAPKETTKNGLYELIISVDKPEYLRYKVLVTSKDLSQIAKLARKSHYFMFQRKEDEQWATVQDGGETLDTQQDQATI